MRSCIFATSDAPSLQLLGPDRACGVSSTFTSNISAMLAATVPCRLLGTGTNLTAGAVPSYVWSRPQLLHIPATTESESLQYPVHCALPLALLDWLALMHLWPHCHCINERLLHDLLLTFFWDTILRHPYFTGLRHQPSLWHCQHWCPSERSAFTLQLHRCLVSGRSVCILFPTFPFLAVYPFRLAHAPDIQHFPSRAIEMLSPVTTKAVEKMFFSSIFLSKGVVLSCKLVAFFS